MVNVRLLADLPYALDSAAPGTILNKDAGGLGFDSASYDDLGATGSIDSAAVLSIANSSYLSSRISTGGFNAKNHLDSGVGNSLVPDSSGRTVRIGNYSKPINNLYLDSASTVYIGSNHSFSLTSSHIEFNGGTASSFSAAAASASAEGNWYGDRGMAAGGYYGSSGSFRNNIDYYDITTLGNATDFGDLTIGKYGLGGISDKTYFLIAGGWVGAGTAQSPDNQAYTRQIDYVTIATSSNASSFGNLSLYNGYSASMCDGSRGVKAGGDYSVGTSHGNVTNEISYVTVTVPSDASDFGDLSVARSGPAGFSDGTYGYIAGGCSASIYTTSPSSIWQNSIDVITMQTTGNATQAGGGTLDPVVRHMGAHSNTTYGIWGGGRNNSNTNINSIQRMTMSTSASSTDFGDLTTVIVAVSCSGNSTRAVWNGQGSPSINNTMQYVTIDTPGNSADFGDLVVTGGHRFSGSGNAS